MLWDFLESKEEKKRFGVNEIVSIASFWSNSSSEFQTLKMILKTQMEPIFDELDQAH